MRPLFVLAGLLAACGSGMGSSDGSMLDYSPPIPTGSFAETARHVVPDNPMGVSGIHNGRRQVIQDAATWASIWHEMTAEQFPKPELPAVDFATETVLVAAMGDCMSNGFTIGVDGVFAAPDGSVTAGVSSVSPDPMCMMMMGQVMTQPLDAVAIPKASAVSFAERMGMSMCTNNMGM